MAKIAPFFSHDMNARHDPKISAMRGVYGSEGYGLFWMLVEMMAESDGYKLDCKSKYAFNAYAMQLHADPEHLQKFVTDCITEFELFDTDNMFFWSNSLRNRMRYRDAVSEKRTAAANKRWENQQKDANASESDANAMQMHQKTMQNHANETKQNETKKHIADSDECGEWFEQFWNLYPKKQGKTVAEKKFKSYYKNGLIDFEKVMKGTLAYIEYVKKERARGFDRQYMDGSTYVNQQRWKDDYKVVEVVGKRMPEAITLSEEEGDLFDRAYKEQVELNKKNVRTERRPHGNTSDTPA